ncbi:radical SAM protein [Desulfitobacterium chlororespirans]|uniref:Radical SAM additional 4Fe4S-binding SPASM domain-containing protein n=1 Tax=Desulfitobacterium chlororespirans DSM 11544 TaxID=1121395 RepID=A0A1M7TQS5_9FIRM|nr:radical SAM protein [Desulfitobacterium chlororespirans]SHN73094.1 radical SAM additional 4Fe4S-binding SPASM domain-containing protein [Desulfitobacterium chlororespirans DSM 11544]
MSTIINLPTSASFLVTEDCNLRCTYCFEKHKQNHMTREVARKGLEYLCESAIKNGDDHFHAMLFGGEPLLNPDIVEEILSYGLELGKKYSLIFTASMVTNATILTDDVKRIMKTYQGPAQLSVQLSVDGVKDVHDAYRVTRAGEGSFDVIAKNIPQWQELFADNPRMLNIHGCSNKKTLPRLYENYLFFREEWGFERIWFMPIHSEDWDENDVGIYEEQLGKIADYILERSKREGNIAEVDNYAPIDRCLKPDGFPGAPCGAGKNFVTITASGELYPCHQIYFNDPEKTTKIGDIWAGIDEPRRAIFVNYDNEDMTCAKDNPECDAYGCYRCIAEHWQRKGSIISTIRGPRCKMSQVERKIQLKIREELMQVGLLNQKCTDTRKGNNPNNPDCLCDSRGGAAPENITNPVSKCGCGNSEESDNDVIAFALKTVLNKLDTIEKEQALILKKLL